MFFQDILCLLFIGALETLLSKYKNPVDKFPQKEVKQQNNYSLLIPYFLLPSFPNRESSCHAEFEKQVFPFSERG